MSSLLAVVAFVALTVSACSMQRELAGPDDEITGATCGATGKGGGATGATGRGGRAGGATTAGGTGVAARPGSGGGVAL